MPEPSRRGRNTRAYRRKAQRVKRDGRICWICGDIIDPSLPYHHKMAGTADHADPLATGGDILGELRPAHRSCNSRRGTGDAPEPTPTSRQW